jgi:hypothetical protein
MSVIYGSAAAPVVYGSHYGGIDGSGYFSRKQIKRAIKYGSYFGGAALGAPVVSAPVVLAPLYDVESRYYFEGGYRSSKHYAPYFHHYAPHVGGIDVSSAVSIAPSTVKSMNGSMLPEPIMRPIRRTLVLLQATGSMMKSIEGCKKTISDVFSRAYETLKAAKVDAAFELQVATFRNYDQEPAQLLCCSKWAKSPEELQLFLQNVRAFGGDAASFAFDSFIDIFWLPSLIHHFLSWESCRHALGRSC